jgi:hypothetical protein
MRVICSILVGCSVLFLSSTVSAGDLKGRVKKSDGPVVVWVEGVAGQVPKSDVPITHVAGGAFEPGMSIGFVGRDFVFANKDDKLHNTHLYMRLAHQKDVSGRPLKFGSTVYNVALPHPGATVKKPIKPYHRYREDTGFIEIVCNAHPNERAFMIVFDHPYATIADKDGSFRLAGLPEGNHEVRYWHRGEIKTWRSVKVSAGAADIVIDLE